MSSPPFCLPNDRRSRQTPAAWFAALDRLPARAGRHEPAGVVLGRAVQIDKADAFAGNVLPIIRQVQAGGATSLRAIADALNARNVRTARGGEWSAMTVSRIMAVRPDLHRPVPKPLETNGRKFDLLNSSE